MARARSEKSLARFDRIALVLSGGGGLGAYQAGAYAALEHSGVRPNWIAGTAIGAINAAIIAGNLPHERVSRLRQFWQELSRRVAGRGDGWGPRRVRRWLAGRSPNATRRRRPRPPRSRARAAADRTGAVARTAARGGRFRPGQFRRGAARARRGQSRHRRRSLFRQRPPCARSRACARQHAAAGNAARDHRRPALWRRGGVGRGARRGASGRHALFCHRRLRPDARQRRRRQPLGARDRGVAPQSRSAADDRAARRTGAGRAARRSGYPQMPRRGERGDDDDPAPRA